MTPKPREGLKAGDRVACYLSTGRRVGTVMGFHQGDLEAVNVLMDGYGMPYIFHTKQLRRLKRRERRRVYISAGALDKLKDMNLVFHSSDGSEIILSDEPHPERTEFVEARPRKENSSP